MTEASIPTTAAACVPQETVLENIRLANAYVPFQKLCDTYAPADALRRGTAFPPLHDVYGWRRRMEDPEDE